jgi:biopolymer transport protein ExbB
LQINLFQQLAAGGLGVWVIAGLSILMIAVAIEQWQRSRPSVTVPPDLVDAILPLWRAGRLEEVSQLLARHRSVLANTLRFIVDHHARMPVDQLDARAGEITSRALRAQQQRAYPLAIIATVAPIVGLLGTVIGMIEAFHVITSAGGMGNASLLAGGISKALVNTAAGLSVALPALGLHHFFRYRLGATSLALEEQVERVLDACVRGLEGR